MENGGERDQQREDEVYDGSGKRCRRTKTPINLGLNYIGLEVKNYTCFLQDYLIPYIFLSKKYTCVFLQGSPSNGKKIHKYLMITLTLKGVG